MVRRSIDPQTLQMSAITLCYLPELHGKITLLRKLTTRVPGYGKIKMAPLEASSLLNSFHRPRRFYVQYQERKILNSHTQVCTLEATTTTSGQYVHRCNSGTNATGITTHFL